MKSQLPVPILCLFLLWQPCRLISQGPESPLNASFQSHQDAKRNTLFDLEWISLGPTLNSARVESVQLDPSRPGRMYVAFGSGNLWKTENHGLDWKPIFEDQPALGIGDIALAPSNPDIIYLGTGESLKKPRNFTMPGTGVFRSDDAGENWRYLGLPDSWHIGEIAIHPTDPDIVYVAVLGHFWSVNANRGIYRSLDGGKSWEQVLFINERTGGNDVVISPSNPQVIYASLWENFPGVSGPNSAVYKSTDGGQSWTRQGNGFPNGPHNGRIGLAVSYSDPDKVYALIDNLNKEKTLAAEVYKTTDGGKYWSRSHEEELLIFPRIGWYFTDIYVNPLDDEEIFALGVRMAHSTNGGQTFELIGGTVHHFTPSVAQTLHLDHCELWINPENPAHMALGNDGGLYISYDKGQSWMHYNNIPTGEFYDITVDQQDPYLIYGGVQDDATVYGPAREWNPDFNDPWKYLWIDAWSGGDGCVSHVDPEDPDIVYFSMQNGAARRRDMRTGVSKSIRPKIPGDTTTELNFNFIAPYLLSPHRSQTLYHAGNYVFRSEDRGDNWEIISPDLPSIEEGDRQSVAAGALAESPLIPGRLYVGTDRGAFWTSPDSGRHWNEHSVGLPSNYIRSICPSRFAGDRVYITLTGINYDDLGNYVYLSEDNGEHWSLINRGLPAEMANVVLEDPKYEDILYLGMYRGVYISLDRGNSWSLLGPNLPNVSIGDLVIQESANDLVVGTHGRGIYKMNLDPIHTAFEKGLPLTSNFLFEIPGAKSPAIRDTHRDVDVASIEKIPITFWLVDNGTVTLTVRRPTGEIIWTRELIGQKGFNQFRWDLMYRENESMQPYFVRYRQYLKKGDYSLTVEQHGVRLERRLLVD